VEKDRPTCTNFHSRRVRKHVGRANSIRAASEAMLRMKNSISAVSEAMLRVKISISA